ncbi:hypothetical protein SASPL_143767 [Salvia splendens]|uniref:Uncharacterized protein n=1 Tax=Salvia splendens TaxID=180675 RepID=A0A8X8WM77_SALSN|nr:hypothetical protein SASPL_143767 [Salvia splendens]
MDSEVATLVYKILDEDILPAIPPTDRTPGPLSFPPQVPTGLSDSAGPSTPDAGASPSTPDVRAGTSTHAASAGPSTSAAGADMAYAEAAVEWHSREGNLRPIVRSVEGCFDNVELRWHSRMKEKGDVKYTIYAFTFLSRVSNSNRVSRRAGNGTWGGQTAPKMIQDS